MSDPLFNSYQKTAVTVTLQKFEEDLRQAIHWLDGQNEQGILYRRRLEMPEEQRRLARARIELALEEIRALAQRLDLETEEENASRTIVGHISIDWENLSGTRARNLGSYGAVHPDLGKILDQPMERLAELAVELTSLFLQASS